MTQTSFVVQVKGTSVDTVFQVASRQASLRIASLAGRATAASGSVLAWRVADAKGLAATASSTEINGLGFSSWQAVTTGTAGVTRISGRTNRFNARSTSKGIAITAETGFTGELEILDAAGKRLGTMAASGECEFRTAAKGLLVVRSADQAIPLTRF